jgi:ethanolamine utilization protein EutQ (cupin superfamily)
MVFVDSNGFPELIKHSCEASRIGEPISDQELMDFAIDLLVNLYTKQGMLVCDKNRIQNCEFPNLVLKNQKGKQFFIVVKVERFPVSPLDISKDDCFGCKELAEATDGRPVTLLAAVSFGCATNAKSVQGLCNTIAGGGLLCFV